VAELEALKRQIATAEDLQNVVKTMKGLAAVSIRQYEKAVEALVDYNRAVELGLHVVLRNRPDMVEGVWQKSPRCKLAAVVFGTDQGMCGQFNEQITGFALRSMDGDGCPAGRRVVVAVGGRLAGRLTDAGQPVEEAFALPNSLSVVNSLVQELLVRMQAWMADETVHGVQLFYNSHERGSAFHPCLVRLLPLDRAWLGRIRATAWPTKMLPQHGGDGSSLFSALVRQYVYVSVFRATAESLAAENASRLAAMQAAEKNIEERLVELHGGFHRQRQMTITEELLDIVGGFEAMARD